MVSQKMTVKCIQGLHMRPAGIFAKEMGKFSSNIGIIHNDQYVNAKSILNIIAACIKCGDEIVVECSGEDEMQALTKAFEIINTAFEDKE